MIKELQKRVDEAEVRVKAIEMAFDKVKHLEGLNGVSYELHMALSNEVGIIFDRLETLRQEKYTAECDLADAKNEMEA